MRVVNRSNEDCSFSVYTQPKKARNNKFSLATICIHIICAGKVNCLVLWMKMKKLNSSALVPLRHTCLRVSGCVYRQSEDGYIPSKHDNRAYPFFVGRSERIEVLCIGKLKVCLYYYDSLYRFLTFGPFLYTIWQR